MSRVYSGCDWVCAACTFENSLRKSSCEICGSLKPTKRNSGKLSSHMSEILYQRPKYSARKSSQKMRPKSLKTDLTPNNSKDDIEIVFVNSNCENSEEKTLNNENESENEEIASNSSDTVNSADLESHSWNSSQDSIHTIEARISEDSPVIRRQNVGVIFKDIMDEETKSEVLDHNDEGNQTVVRTEKENFEKSGGKENAFQEVVSERVLRTRKSNESENVKTRVRNRASLTPSTGNQSLGKYIKSEMISKYKNSSCRIVEFHYEKKKKVENFLITDTNCFICSEPYTKKAMMKHFKEFHENVENFKCHVCPSVFYRFDTLRNHIRENHHSASIATL